MAKTFVQSISGGATSSSPSVTLGSTPAQGDLLVAVVEFNENAGATTFTMSASGWTLVPTDGDHQGTGIHGDLYWKIAGASEATVVNGTLGASRAWFMAVMQFHDSGGGTWGVDVHTQNSGSGTSHTTGTTATTTDASEVAVGALGSKNASTYASPQNGFTLQEKITGGGTGAGTSGAFLYKILTATGTQATGATGGNFNFVGVICTFKIVSTTFNQALTTTAVAVTATMQRQANKLMIATAVVCTASLVKKALKNLTTTAVAVTASVRKLIYKTLIASELDANTVVLLHMDGSNGSTLFLDSSYAGHPFSTGGNAQVTTAQSKFGGASAVFDGAGDYITTPNKADLDFGTGDFTVDFWFRVNTAAAVATVVARRNGFGAWIFYLAGGANLYFYSSSAGVSWDIAGDTLRKFNPSTITLGQWNHVAIVRQGTTFTGYWNGVQGFQFTNSSAVLNTSQPMTVGANTGGVSESFDGWVDEVRVSNVARWTSNFTPPAYPYGTVGVYTSASLTALRVFLKTLTTTAVAVTASMVRRTNKNLTATSAVTAVVNKGLKKTLTTTAVAVTAVLRKQMPKTLSASVAATASISKRIGKFLATSSAVTATLTTGRVYVKNLVASVHALAVLTANKLSIPGLTCVTPTSLTMSATGVGVLSATCISPGVIALTCITPGGLTLVCITPGGISLTATEILSR